MKFLFRSAPVQWLLGLLFAAYLGVTLKTLRWRRDGMADAEAVWDAGGPVMVCFWHSRISLSPASWPLERAQEPRALISLSHDGEVVAQAMERLGFPAIRGSAAKKQHQVRQKGGAAAFREIVRWLKDGNCIAIPPDGPRGPVETMTNGPAMLARRSKAQVLLLGLATKPCVTLNSWDRAVFPLPFARAALIWERQPDVADDDDIEAVRQAWTERLSALTRQAEAAVE
ncbi:MAG: lysophospholipid acyltransferase family protein [Caulobacteraceae bacterium]|nr:lysophospholipid acyltransferase family protein [Caulobacteraceae bacterium]